MKVGRAAQSFPYGIIALEIVELPLITAEQKDKRSRVSDWLSAATIGRASSLAKSNSG
jgi:hypothetical protein